jgi:hypothetical protein
MIQLEVDTDDEAFLYPRSRPHDAGCGTAI